jgi:flavin-dependent dehydrogenase
MPGVLAVGETVGTTFPLSGEGIGKAMETGERAAEVIARALESNDSGVLREFDDYLAGLRPLYEAYRTGEAWLARPWLNDIVAFLARRSVYARASFANILEETANPAAIFSMRGILRMLIG